MDVREEDLVDDAMLLVVLQVPKGVEESGQGEEVLEDEVALPEHVKGQLHLRRSIHLFAR